MPGKAELLERERRWSLPVALMTFASVVLGIASIAIASGFAGDGSADFLREVDEDSGSYLLSAGLQAVGFLLLAAPLGYLFRAVQGRSERVRAQLWGLVLVAPLFFAAGTVLTAISNVDAASAFVDANVSGTGEAADERARDFQAEADLRNVGAGMGIAGTLGLTVITVYTMLWALRTGLLSRFWGSLGIALGAISFIIPTFLPFLLVLLVYLGLLIAGWLPSRPPAWDAGEAVPWPSPGERMAEEMEPRDADPGAVEDEAREVAAESELAGSPRQRGERRKRKRRQ
jgi:hypothetical protein